MTARELIENLQRLPGNRSVVVDYSEIGPTDDGHGLGAVDPDGYTDVLGAGESQIERGGAHQDVVAITVGLE